MIYETLHNDSIEALIDQIFYLVDIVLMMREVPCYNTIFIVVSIKLLKVMLNLKVKIGIKVFDALQTNTLHFLL